MLSEIHRLCTVSALSDEVEQWIGLPLIRFCNIIFQFKHILKATKGLMMLKAKNWNMALWSWTSTHLP